MNSIPELAEQLRHHINTDNDAKRLICEHILPLVGIEVDSQQEFEDILTSAEKAEESIADARRWLAEDIERYKDVIDDKALESLRATLNAISESDDE